MDPWPWGLLYNLGYSGGNGRPQGTTHLGIGTHSHSGVPDTADDVGAVGVEVDLLILADLIGAEMRASEVTKSPKAMIYTTMAVGMAAIQVAALGQPMANGEN